MMIDANGLNLQSQADMAKYVQPICASGASGSLRHSGGANALFGDGHVAYYQWDDISGATPQSAQLTSDWFTLY